MIRDYDLAISVGGACSTTEAMRAAGLQWVTLPLDWTGGPGLDVKIGLLANGFEGFLAKDALRRQPAVKFSREIFMKDERLGFLFNHDFHYGVPFDEDYLQVKAKFDRRIRRMYELLARSRKVLLLWIGVPASQRYTEAELAGFLDVLRRRWPDKRIDLLYSESVGGVAFADRTDREENGVRRVAFDYRKREKDNREWLADVPLLTGWLKSEYAVRDYRTAAEKAAWKSRRRRTRYARYHADGFFDYIRTRLEYKLFRHLGKQLDRKGLA